MIYLLPLIMGEDSEYHRAIKVKLLLFGSIAEIFGRKKLEVAVEYGTTVNQLISRFHLSDKILSGIKVAVEGQIIDDLDIQLRDSSEIALMPPFSGG